MSAETLGMSEAVDDRLSAAAAIMALAAVAPRHLVPDNALDEALGHARALVEEARAIVEAFHEAQLKAG